MTTVSIAAQFRQFASKMSREEMQELMEDHYGYQQPQQQKPQQTMNRPAQFIDFNVGLHNLDMSEAAEIMLPHVPEFWIARYVDGPIKKQSYEVEDFLRQLVTYGTPYLDLTQNQQGFFRVIIKPYQAWYEHTQTRRSRYNR